MRFVDLRGVTHESFLYETENGDRILWDITVAKELCDAGQVLACLEIPPDQMRAIRDRNEVRERDIDQADPTEPGIAAPIVDEGKIIYVLIDGNHRNARALRDGLPFRANLLTDDAARRCVLQAPLHRMPWGYAVIESSGASKKEG